MNTSSSTLNGNSDGFLPDNYEAPSGNAAYMKLQDGENKVRILSKPIIGWLDWKDKKPFRFKMANKPDKPMEKGPIKHFWAFLVWNYDDQSIQILEITQQTIQKAIQDYSKNDEWGAPFFYDLKIIRKGKDLDTEYSIMPSPKKDLSEEIKKAALEKPANLEALYDGADPWVVTDKQTEYAFTTLPF